MKAVPDSQKEHGYAVTDQSIADEFASLVDVVPDPWIGGDVEAAKTLMASVGT